MYIKREILEYLKATLNKEPCLILTGSRQVGKTTLIKKIEEDLKKEDQKTYYFNLELPSHLSLFSHGPEGFLEYLTAQGVRLTTEPIQNYLYLFIDEFQYIPQAGKFLKAIIDNFPQIKTVASGSSSVEIQKSLQESLVGRKRVINIFPLNFVEFLRFQNLKEAAYFEEVNVIKPLSVPLRSIFVRLFEEFTVWGGMPKIILEPDPRERRALLEEICSSYLQKDIKGLVGSENLSAFNKLMVLLAEESSSLSNIHSLSNTLRLSRKELEKALFILENTFVNWLLNPFYTNKRKELSREKKTVFYDNGIRNCLLNNFSPFDQRLDKGRLQESAVYNELKKSLKPGMEILYWRTQHQTEIDFILRSDEKVIPIEVKSGSLQKVPASVSSFVKQYQSPFAVVINKDNWTEVSTNGFKVYFLPAFVTSLIPSLLPER